MSESKKQSRKARSGRPIPPPPSTNPVNTDAQDAVPAAPDVSDTAALLASAETNAESNGTIPDRPAPWKHWAERMFGIDLRALGIVRILLAIYLLADLGQRALDMGAFYTEDGVFPHAAAIKHTGHILVYLSPYMYVSTTTGVSILFLITALAGIGMLLGWRTRIMTAIAWYLTISLHYRNGLVLHSGDVYLRLLMFWSLFVPMGARFSLDGLAAARRAHGQPIPTRVTSFGTAALLLQVAFVYWFTAILKNAPEWRGEGTAIYYALSIEQYAVPLGQWLLQVRWLLKPLTHLTFGLEIAAPTLVFSPWLTERFRVAVVPIMMSFHVIALNLTLDIGSLPYICAIPWLLFLPPSTWDALTAFWRRLPNTAPKGAIERVRIALISWRNSLLTVRLKKGMPTPSLRLSLFGQMTAAILIVYMLLWNIHTTDLPFRKILPRAPEPVTWFTRIDQSWGMFAPRPMIDDGWFVIPAVTRDRKQVDLFRNGQPVRWEKPPVTSHMYPNQRWCKYMMNLWGRVNEPYRPYYCQYLEREWNRTHPKEQELLSLQFIYMQKDTLPDYAPAKPVRRLLWTHNKQWTEEELLAQEPGRIPRQ
jgi:hypothetical protein